jgi:adenylate cyclase class IV
MKTQYEVEIRCHFNSAAEAFTALPFLQGCLGHSMVWSSNICAPELFQAGLLLRMSKTTIDGKPKYFLGWKGPDTGSFANIREEIDEVITDGIADSLILHKLGIRKGFLTREQIRKELKSRGLGRFMAFRGGDRFGYYEPLGLHLKLMGCRALKWPVLVEFEKTAHSLKETKSRESELREFCDSFGLNDRLVREEPPTLLYEARFGEGIMGFSKNSSRNRTSDMVIKKNPS